MSADLAGRVATLWSEGAEQAVVSAILNDPVAIATVSALLTPDAFFRPAHARIFQAILDLQARGSVVDPLTLSEHLGGLEQLDSIGGREYVGYLIDVVPTAANVEYHAKIVAELARRREAIRAAQAFIQTALDRTTPIEGPAGELTAALLPVAASLTGRGFRHIRDIIPEVVEELERLALGELPGRAFGYRDLDDQTGGMQAGELMFVCGVPGSAKTAFGLNLMARQALPSLWVPPNVIPGVPPMGCAIVSAEMKDRQLVKRFASNLGRVNGLDMRRGTLADGDYVKLGNAFGMLTRAPLYIDDTATPKIRVILAKLRALKAKHPEIGWALVDFIQLVQGDDEDSRAEELSIISYALKGVAKELDLRMVATCQVDAKNIETRTDKKPTLGDLRWSQAMREAGDLIALLYRPAMYEELPDGAPDLLEADFAKARDMPPFTARFLWRGRYLQVEDYRAGTFAPVAPQERLW